MDMRDGRQAIGNRQQSAVPGQANSKAKKLRSLLKRQKACKKKEQVPWIDATVFCSAAGLKFELQDKAPR